MPKLKPKNLNNQNNSSAFALPDIMANMESNDVKSIPISKLKRADNRWNFYKPLNTDKMEELIVSILENGLIHPIVVSENNDNTYTILSGHNRVLAYNYIFDRTKDNDYLNILASIKRGLTEDEEREIIIDSNWVQRVLSPSEKSRSIYEKYIILGRKKRNKNGEEHLRNYDVLAKDYNLSGKQIQRYIKLNNLTDNFLKLLDEEKITIRACVKIANFNYDTQNYIYSLLELKNFIMESQKFEKLNINMTHDDIKNILLGDNNLVNVSFKIPENLKKDFISMCENWILENKVD